MPKGPSLTDADNAAAVAAAATALGKAPGVASAPDPLRDNLQQAVENFAGNLPSDEAQAVLAVEDNLPPQLSKNGRIAYTTVTFDESLNDLIDAYPVGWAKGAVGLSATIPIVSFVPLVMFVILFGLSMDYEVFLMSRIREEWDRTQSPRESVVLGVANTARVITTAALIMIAVYASFVTNATVKLIGFGMAVAVLIDSTPLRMVLVPAVMELFGKAAWWFPRGLEWIPHVNIEGTPEPTREPVPVAAGATATAPDEVGTTEAATTPSPDRSPAGS